MSKITQWASKDGQFRRHDSVFRDWISRKQGSVFMPERDRYHLYISHACPWAHRVAIVRTLKGLEEVLPLSVVSWHMGDKGWAFDPSIENATDEPLYGYKHLSDLYFKAQSDYSGRYTVPVLWDKKNETIVSNESSEIIRMLYHEFDEFVDEAQAKLDLLPKHLESDIDEMNKWVYDTVNNGVYKSGFATTQEAYESNVIPLFKALDRLESILKDSKGPYLCGTAFTEADIRLFTTIIRFDPVYVQHFKCNIGMIRYDFPHLHTWLRHLYWDFPPIRDTVFFDHIKKHYTKVECVFFDC